MNGKYCVYLNQQTNKDMKNSIETLKNEIETLISKQPWTVGFEHGDLVRLIKSKQSELFELELEQGRLNMANRFNDGFYN